jgi:hypothetical protein
MEEPAVALAPAVGATAPAAAAAAAAAEELAELRAANDASPADGTPWHDDTVGDGGGTAPKLPDAVESGYTDAHHAEFMERGFLQLGRLLPGPELAAMDRRIDEIMLGQHVRPRRWLVPWLPPPPACASTHPYAPAGVPLPCCT